LDFFGETQKALAYQGFTTFQACKIVASFKKRHVRQKLSMVLMARYLFAISFVLVGISGTGHLLI
jgi:hypothetical protein